MQISTNQIKFILHHAYSYTSYVFCVSPKHKFANIYLAFLNKN